MSRPLSPAAQAVLTAQAKERCLFEWSAVNDPPCHPSAPGWNGCVQCADRRGIAAALRAAADHVVPASKPPQRDSFPDRSVWQWAVDCHNMDEATRSKFLAIADELEAQSNG
jgi:hypothetical protein